MSLGLTAPCALPVEVRDSSRRAFRVALQIGPEGASFGSPLPFEPDAPVTLRFRLPDGQGPFEVRARTTLLGADAEREGEAGCMAAAFADAPSEIKNPLGGYVRTRLGLETF